MNPELLPVRGEDAMPSHPPVVRFADSNFFYPALQQIFRCLAVAALAMASYFLITRFVFRSVQIVGVSMAPTLQDNDHYFVSQWVYYLREPGRGDIVVLKDPTDGTYSVKRIVALDGDAIAFKCGKVYLNGREMKETYLPSGTQTFYLTAGQDRVACGERQYFVMGDNRKASHDSRLYGTVPRENIIGVIIP